MSAGVTSGEQCGVSGSGAGVGIVVVAVGEIGAAVKKDAEASVTELVAVAFEIITAELVDHNHDHKLGAGVVSGGESGRSQAEQHQCNAQGPWKSHRRVSLQEKNL